MMKYHVLLKIVNPKRVILKEMTEKLITVRKSLSEKKAELDSADEKLQTKSALIKVHDITL